MCHFVWPSAKSAFGILHLSRALEKWECELSPHLLVYLPKQPLNALLNKKLEITSVGSFNSK